MYQTPLNERLYNMYNCVDDELHVVTAYGLNLNERRTRYDTFMGKILEFKHLGYLEKFVFLFMA